MPVNARDRLVDGTVDRWRRAAAAVLQSHVGCIRHQVQREAAEYALGRRLEYFDMPAVRRIVAGARATGQPALVLRGNSVPFQHRHRTHSEPRSS